ncbi:hypothetical protein CONCODRAFT_11900 [Conidiobolus coronatus NRRL 28638]|uniref:Transcription factor domain-containing protein n=1 Tax=Conidiobolus coronatus (strain ATCC 28846 / CBS 209.66 / NRRL 28638) TaxID=796925 RepID=A0A137NU96_CONC2|nr:hypothetical protein CONCODRAFT_11900 [Conidiobolus coronatus NRRL 28638]|eukprot:KXN66292.1 hypothetical protein CONCODRAFT_11900 [Conidiobolus coronatus NRRL 28638]
MKFNKNSSTLSDLLNVTRKYIDYSSSSSNLNDRRSLSLIQYTHKCDYIHNYEWSNFQKFIYRWRDDLQNIPRIKSFIEGQSNVFNHEYNRPNPQYNSVMARPLLLILQKSFWDDLIKAYFKFIHPKCMILCLSSFNPKTASKALLSAIYFAGFVAQPNPSDELLAYMETYALTSIKKTLLSVKLSSAQALGIYSYAFLLIENSSMSRVCLSHFGRMCYALGININRSNLPILDQFNRKFTYNIMKIYYNWTKLEPSSHDLVSEEVEIDLSIYKPKYQIPSPDLNLFDNVSDSIVYSIFCSQFTKNFNHSVYIASKFIKYDSNKIEDELEELQIKTVEIHDKAKSALESMIDLLPECKMQILMYLEYIKAVFITIRALFKQ